MICGPARAHKTLFMVLLLAARSPPTKVFFGAALAFLAHGVIAVLLGQVLALLPHAVVKYGAAGLFLVFGLLLLFRREPAAVDSHLEKQRHTPLVTAFLFIFIAEWGDMTQILTAAMVAHAAATLGRVLGSLMVLTGAVLGLWAGAALAAFVGHRAGKWLPEKVVHRVAGICFLGVAAYVGLWAK